MIYANFSLRNDKQFKVMVPAWKHEAAKRIAAKEGITLTALINAMLDKKLDEHRVKAELRVVDGQ